MKTIDAKGMHFKALNEIIKSAGEDVKIENCLGQRYIGCGLDGIKIDINGIPGNALGAYLDGAIINVNGNSQDATGDTMNNGTIYIHGSAGDATGYAMRGGKIFVEGDSGYRTGIHMKAYKDKLPVLVIGGKCGSFLGEYQSGGIIIVLRECMGDEPFHNNFCAAGMHGGKIFIRCKGKPLINSPQLNVDRASEEDIELISPYIQEFSEAFGRDFDKVIKQEFYVITPNTSNPYKQLYVRNI